MAVNIEEEEEWNGRDRSEANENPGEGVGEVDTAHERPELLGSARIFWILSIDEGVCVV